MEWDIISKPKKQKLNIEEIVNILLKNRDIEDKKEFFKPIQPSEISLKDIGFDPKQLTKAIKRIKLAQKNHEKVIIFGDYDADGICASAILWEAIYSQKINVLPFIPDRFTDGYGLKPESLKRVLSIHPDTKLIITVDNGIVAHDAVEFANKNSIDVIITDHHTPIRKNPNALAIIHTLKTSGSAVAWFFAKELGCKMEYSLELAAMGTIADQLPLTGINRSIVKYGLESLRKSSRIGILSLLAKAGIPKEKVGVYEVGFVIAPRINAMGRLADATDSLRLLCTKSVSKAGDIAATMDKTNQKRQQIVEEVILHARKNVFATDSKGAMLLIHESYHEGIIGLAASKLVEEFGRPAIVVSKGEIYSKASARSVSGINITEVLRELGFLLKEVGGHEMAAGFTIESVKLSDFAVKLEELTAPLITDQILNKKLTIDCELQLPEATWELAEKLVEFEPTGSGNPSALFATFKAKVKDGKTVGKVGKHLKLRIEQKGQLFDAIAFGKGDQLDKILGKDVDIAYALEVNEWNGSKSLQLNIRDLKLWKKNSKN